MNVVQLLDFFEEIENFVENEENAGFQHYFPFFTMFSTLSENIS